tara:strand:+ start:394 stop:663 length:270 start_codon:yes stop_codon:yes gene_type:complete
MNNIVTIEAWESYKDSKESQLKRLKKEHKEINDKLTKRVSDEVFNKLMLEQELIWLDIKMVENNIKSSELSLKNFMLTNKKIELLKEEK